jgi:hypothetical protein
MLLTTQGGTPFLRFFSTRESRFAPRGSKVMHMWAVEDSVWVKESRKETMCALPGWEGEAFVIWRNRRISSRAVSEYLPADLMIFNAE